LPITWREDFSVVIPAEAGIHGSSAAQPRPAWMPACAGMTEWGPAFGLRAAARAEEK
jgi:hypothetical protein